MAFIDTDRHYLAGALDKVKTATTPPDLRVSRRPANLDKTSPVDVAQILSQQIASTPVEVEGFNAKAPIFNPSSLSCQQKGTTPEILYYFGVGKYNDLRPLGPQLKTEVEALKVA